MDGKLQFDADTVRKLENEKILSPGRVVWNRLKKNKLAICGFIIIMLILLVSIIGPIVSPYNMADLDLTNVHAVPSFEHILGTDEIGRDVFTRLMYAGRVSLAIGFFSVIVEVLFGSILGVISGYYGGIVDSIIMRLVDIFL